MQTRITYISIDLKTCPQLQWAVGRPGVQFVNFDSTESLESGPRLLIVSEKTLSQMSQAYFGALDKASDSTMVLVYDKVNPAKSLEWLMNCTSINHLVSLKSERSEQDLQKLVFTPNYSHYLENLELKDSVKWALTEFDNSHNVFEEIGGYAASLNSFPDFPRITQTIVSELLNNAFFDAKQEQSSSGKDKSQMPTDAQVELRYGKEDSGYLWIFVKDPFGSLDRRKLLFNIHRVADQKTAQFSESDSGAGIGLAMLFNWSTSLHFVVTKEKSTLVACSLKIVKRNREFQLGKSSLHISMIK